MVKIGDKVKILYDNSNSAQVAKGDIGTIVGQTEINYYFVPDKWRVSEVTLWAIYRVDINMPAWSIRKRDVEKISPNIPRNEIDYYRWLSER